MYYLMKNKIKILYYDFVGIIKCKALSIRCYRPNKIISKNLISTMIGEDFYLIDNKFFRSLIIKYKSN